jgi:hypothetical protein
MMPINIHTLCWNEILAFRQMFDFYKARFPTTEIRWHIYDFGSDDGTRELALSLGMNLYNVDTGGTLNDLVLVQLKNSVWKRTGSWAIVTDFDEWLDINEKQLAEEVSNGTTILKVEGWDICNVSGLDNLAAITTGRRWPYEDKKICFDARLISEMRYGLGAHECAPLGCVQYSERAYNLLHMKYLNEEHYVNRLRLMAKRISPENRRAGWSFHLFEFNEEKARKNWRDALESATTFR